MSRGDLTEAEWRLLKGLLPIEPANRDRGGCRVSGAARAAGGKRVLPEPGWQPCTPAGHGLFGGGPLIRWAMAIWALLMGSAAGLALGGPLGALAGAAIGAAVDRVLAARAANPQRRQVAFTIAAIALAAKMAQADGYASEREAEAFERLFHVPADEKDNMRRFYRLARQSVDGHEAYARQAASLLGEGSPVLEDLIEALLMIATVDGVHPAEIEYLQRVSGLMGFDARKWAEIRARHIPLEASDPHAVLGVKPGADDAEIRAAYRRLARDHHPDRHIAQGTPPEFIRVAEARMATINAAYAALMKAAGAKGQTGGSNRA